jgi:hypothetical protein
MNPMKHAENIMAEFEDIFGKLPATERNWLIRRIADGPVRDEIKSRLEEIGVIGKRSSA